MNGKSAQSITIITDAVIKRKKMIDNRDIFPTDILIRKIGIETTFNKERKSYFEKYMSLLGTLNISVGLCKKR